MRVNIMRRYICWVLLTLLHRGLNAEICHSDEDNKCCAGYKRNETTGLCDSCPFGYNGRECAYRCTYPYYGEYCRRLCDCTEEQCNFVNGCKTTSKASKYIYFYTFLK
ncbi:uncharacterized protein LOC144619445 [Crassostrea virginica]